MINFQYSDWTIHLRITHCIKYVIYLLKYFWLFGIEKKISLWHPSKIYQMYGGDINATEIL